MYKAAVMGDYDSIYGFASLGLDVFPVTESEEGAKLLRRLAESEYGVIYMTEELSARMRDAVAAYDAMLSPVIVPIPGVYGNTGEGVAKVKKSVEQAVGSDILFGEEK